MIQQLSSNSVWPFHMQKRIRSNDIRLRGCYFLRRLAKNSMCENRKDPMLSMRLIGPSSFGKAGPSLVLDLFVPHGSLLQTGANISRSLCRNMCPWCITFLKCPSVMDSLCNRKEMASCWADTKKPTCHCTPLRPYLSLLLAPPDTDNHLALNGNPLLLPEQPLHSIANDPYRTRSAHPETNLKHAYFWALLFFWTPVTMFETLNSPHFPY